MFNSQSHLRQLVQQLREAQPARVPAAFCRHCQDELPLFISDELAGQPVDEVYPEVAYHLDICSPCLHEYVELAQLTASALFDAETSHRTVLSDWTRTLRPYSVQASAD
ncbi:MAG: hypothetical protein KKD28_12980 [Chloroflexi bacterium]|nr:hypothetical protein [Chloroflexota bacterium]